VTVWDDAICAIHRPFVESAVRVAPQNVGFSISIEIAEARNTPGRIWCHWVPPNVTFCLDKICAPFRVQSITEPLVCAHET
jgi:hypothetical protein